MLATFDVIKQEITKNCRRIHESLNDLQRERDVDKQRLQGLNGKGKDKEQGRIEPIEGKLTGIEETHTLRRTVMLSAC